MWLICGVFPLGAALIVALSFGLAEWLIFLFFPWIFFVAAVDRNIDCPVCGRNLGALGGSFFGHAFSSPMTPKKCPGCGYNLDTVTKPRP
jgi:ribosomal protein S27E